MKKEPLTKNKRRSPIGYLFIEEDPHWVYDNTDIKSAVEWLIDVINPLSSTTIKRYWVIEAIKQAFPDLYPTEQHIKK